MQDFQGKKNALNSFSSFPMAYLPIALDNIAHTPQIR
jgi:hypothetical protein